MKYVEFMHVFFVEHNYFIEIYYCFYKKPSVSEEQFTAVYNYELLDVTKDCRLDKFIAECDHEYDALRIFFEFVNKAEEITDDKKVIIMNKVNSIIECVACLLANYLQV